jgi:ubiquinone/menaquinone biosynthesis C-methylase UbiE
VAANIQRWVESEACCNPEWEAAYSRFETPQQEERKFLARLRRCGVEAWSRDLHIVDIFCGRGGCLNAWRKLGFPRLEGVDLSENLLRQYTGDAQLYVGDCRRMAFPGESRDVICVQGGLHHLDSIPGDLDSVLAEVHRVLRRGGRFVMVEPWMTPFLGLVHAFCRQAVVRTVSPKFKAFNCMIERERRTYFQWLSMHAPIMTSLGRLFEPERVQIGFGKLLWVGRKRDAGASVRVILPAGAT